MLQHLDSIELPADILEMVKGLASNGAPNIEKLEKIGAALETKKQDAVSYRQSSGIEQTWASAEEAYAGIDDANRGERTGGHWIKARAMHQPLTMSDVGKNLDLRSTAFVRLTTRYVDAGAAKIGEILIPIDDKAFSFDATPVPALVKAMHDQTPVMSKTAPGETLQRDARPDEMPGADPQSGQPPQQVNLTYADLANEAIETAKKKAKLAETQVFDWMVECQHPFEMRKVIFDSARLGVGVLKGPFPDKRRRMAMINGALEIKEDIVPIDKWVDPWNVFPDPACGEDIRNGEYIFERAYYSEKQVRNMKGLPGYLDNQLDKVLLIGPSKAVVKGNNPTEQERKNPYEVWFYYGTMDREDFEVLNPDASKTAKDQVFVIVTMIGDTVVQGTINPLQSGDLPYHAVPWIRKPNTWVGTGVAEQLDTPQRMVNASTRALLNNAGISAGPQIVINQRGIEPANKDWAITPNKIWYLTEAGQTDDIRKAFASISIDNVGDQLYKIVEYAMRLAEESSSIPLITQGLSGKTSPDTLGATQLQDNNANQLLRYIGYSFDGRVTVRLVNGYYEYLLLDPNISDDLKGDFSINAHGSVALVERSIQDQTIAQMTPLAQDPQFGVNPKKWFAMLAKSKHLNPADFQYTPEEQAKIDAQPKPVAPAIEVATIKAKVEQLKLQAQQQRNQQEDQLAMQLAQLDAQIAQQVAELQNTTAQLRIKMDTDRDTVYAQTEAARAQATFENKMREFQLKKDLAMMDYGSQHQLTLEQTKAKLADTAMKLQVTKELAAMDAKLRIQEHATPSGDSRMKPVVQKPVIQVPGKASDGNAFSQL